MSEHVAVADRRRELAKCQLEQLYRHLEADRGRRVTTRNWFISVWLAVLVASASGRLQMPETARILLVIIPVVAFWLLESLAQTFIYLNGERARSLELRLLEDKFDDPLERRDLIVAGWIDMPYSKKLRGLLRVAWRSETVWAFYLVTLACSIAVLSVL